MASGASFISPRKIRTNFPACLAFEEQKYHEMPARFFREVIRRTVYATDNESSRYALGGVLVEFSAGGLTAVATDGRRLARQEGPAQSVGGHVSGDNMTIIPTRAMQLLERALADNEENIQVAARDNDVIVQQRRGDDLLAAGRGPLPEVARCFPAARRNGQDRAVRWPGLCRGPTGGDRHQRRAPRRRLYLRRRQNRLGRPRRRTGRVARRIADRL